MADIFDRLNAIDYFANCDQQLPNDLSPFCVDESSWPKIYTEITSESGADWLMNAQSDLTRWLSANARNRYSGEWNRTVQEARPRIEALVEQIIRPRFPNDKWDEWIGSHFSFALFGIVMADHYSDLRGRKAPLEIYDRMLAILEAGHFLVGWRYQGEWPSGKFVVGRLSAADSTFAVVELTIEQVVEEARRLAKPGWLLKEMGSGVPVATWRGTSDAGTHWITVNWDRLESPFEITGTTTVVETDSLQFDVQHRGGNSSNESNGIPLFAHASQPLPPMFVLQQESEKIQNWWASGDADRQTKYDAYVDAFQSESPFYQRDEDLYAIISGWPIELYLGDWAGRYRLESQLLLTIKDAEPYVELVQHQDGNLSARGIIT